VHNVSWFEALLFCNRLSVAADREPVYKVWGIDDWDSYLAWAFSTRSTLANIYIDDRANGYRLPTNNEWFWAAIGVDRLNPGQVNNTGGNKYYSGGEVTAFDSRGIEDFTWTGLNSSEMPHEVGLKLGNELGIFDMTGNVAELSWEKCFNGLYWATFTSSPLLSTPPSPSGGSAPAVRVFMCGIRVVSNQ
jgi:formylglycine-generating enzyme required for sulfatase activity